MVYGTSSPYNYGGGADNVSPGVDVELKLKPMKLKKFPALYKIHNTSHKALMTGLYYTSNHYSVKGFTSKGDPMASQFDSKYIHVPLLYKFNFQPFILDEDFHISGAIGIMNSFLLNAKMKEQATYYVLDSSGRVVSQTDVADDQDVTTYSQSYFWSFCLDISISFKRLYVGERAYFSFQDQYLNGLESRWGVPADHSIYINAYKTWSSLNYSGGFFYIGWKIN